MPKLVPGYRDEVKEKILEVAWQVLIEKGVHESTVDDIAKALNCSKGAIYNYFRNKEELLQETIIAGRFHFREEFNSRFSQGNFLENAREYFDQDIMKAADRMQLLLGMYLEGTRNTKVREAVKVKYESSVNSIKELLEKLSIERRINLATDAETAAMSLYTLRSGVLMSLVSGVSREDAMKVWMHGISSIVEDSA